MLDYTVCETVTSTVDSTFKLGLLMMDCECHTERTFNL